MPDIYSFQDTYAGSYGRMRLLAKEPKTDSKSADRKVVGVRPPLPAPIQVIDTIALVDALGCSAILGRARGVTYSVTYLRFLLVEL